MRSTLIYCCLLSVILFSCRKRELLEESPISNLRTPKNLEDLQMLLDNTLFTESPGMGEESADNYFVSNSGWQFLSNKDFNTYTWAKDIFMGTGSIADWNGPYEQIFYCNVILRSLGSIAQEAMSDSQRDQIKGAALFLRSNAFFNLAQLFTMPFDQQSAEIDLGLPIRLTDNIQEVSVRSSLKQTYEQIISDATEAKNLLPATIDGAHPNRPTKPAAMALLSRIYMSMQKYHEAGLYADSCLQLHSKLLDYNAIDADASNPFRVNNPEILFYSQVTKSNLLVARYALHTIVDSVLFRLYNPNDLRYSLYYSLNSDGQPIIKSSYGGTVFAFSGFATDELYLNRAECLARAGNVAAAMDDLNTLLKNRWRANTFTFLKAGHAQEALQLILLERRKELPFRSIRWTDLRRLNKEGMNIHLLRTVNGQTYELQPNDIRYAFPIPPDVITLSGMHQNPR